MRAICPPNLWRQRHLREQYCVIDVICDQLQLLKTFHPCSLRLHPTQVVAPHRHGLATCCVTIEGGTTSQDPEVAVALSLGRLLKPFSAPELQIPL